MGGLGQQILLQSVVGPAAVTAVIGWLGGRLLRDRATASAVAAALGLLAAFDLIRGLDLVWPRSAADKLPLACLLGLTGSLIADRRNRPLAGGLVALAGPVVLVAARPMAAGEVGLPLALVGLAVVLWRDLERPVAPVRRTWVLAAVGLGLAGVAGFARTALLAELALAAGTVALATLARPAGSAASLLPVAAVLVGLATALALFTSAPAPALLVIALIPLTGRLTRPLARIVPLGEARLFGLLPLLLAALAAGWSRWMNGPPLYF